MVAIGPGGAEDVIIVWGDSLHQSGGFMLCRRTAVPGAPIAATGSYPAPEGPDWGWRIQLHAEGGDALRIVMYNIWPTGRQGRAVEAVHVRRK